MSSCGLLWLIKSSPAIFLAKILLRGENGGKNGGNRRNENSGKSVPWTMLHRRSARSGKMNDNDKRMTNNLLL
jgi:hypothetical protein